MEEGVRLDPDLRIALFHRLYQDQPKSESLASEELFEMFDFPSDPFVGVRGLLRLRTLSKLWKSEFEIQGFQIQFRKL